MIQIRDYYSKLVEKFGEWQAVTILVAVFLFAIATGFSYDQIIEFLRGLVQ